MKDASPQLKQLRKKWDREGSKKVVLEMLIKSDTPYHTTTHKKIAEHLFLKPSTIAIMARDYSLQIDDAIKERRMQSQKINMVTDAVKDEEILIRSVTASKEKPILDPDRQALQEIKEAEEMETALMTMIKVPRLTTDERGVIAQICGEINRRYQSWR